MNVPRDHRDDGNAISGVFFALPIAVGIWLFVLGAVFLPWLVLAGAIVFAYGLLRIGRELP